MCFLQHIYRMKFKDFIKISEEQSGTDKGLMGYPMASNVKKPSDGQPFKNLGSIAGATPRGKTGGSGAPMMMKKI